jgi:ParB family chromosome partitioning protein
MKKAERPYKGSLSDKVELLFGGGVDGMPTDKKPETFQLVSLASIVLPKYQPRQYFDPEKLAELAQTISNQGILEPLLVRLSPPGQYELVAGGRRYRAAQLASLTEAPVIILNLTDEEALEIALLENLQREDLNPIEETEGLLNLLSSRLHLERDEVTSLLYRMRNQVKKKVSRNVSANDQTEIVETLFSALGLTWKSFVETRLPLLNLPEEVLKALHQGQIAYTKAKAIAKIEAPQQRQQLLDEAIANNLSLNQIKERIKQLSQTPTATTVELTPQQRIKQTLTRLNQTRIWEDSRKKKKLERLLQQLEELMN